MRIGMLLPQRLAEILGWNEWTLEARALALARTEALRRALKAVTLVLSLLLAGIGLWVGWSLVQSLIES